MQIVLILIAVILIMMFPWIIPLFVLLGFIIYFLKKSYNNTNYGKRQKIERNKKEIQQATELQERMNSCGVFPTYIVTNGISTVYFDENNKKIYLKCKDSVLYNQLNEIALNIDDIISYGTDIKTDKNTQYTMRTYFTGKLKQNEDINTIWFSIHINSIDNPYIYFLCSDYSVAIPEANQFANKIIGALDYMKNNKIIKQKPLLNLIPNLETELIKDVKSDVVSEVKKEDKIKIKIDKREQKESDENRLLKKQLEIEQKKVANLQNKLKERKTEQTNKVIKTILNVISYGIAIFWYIGGIVALFSNKIFFSIGYIIIGSSFLPFLYEKIWKNKQLSKNKKIIFKILFIVGAFIIGTIFFSFQTKS